jgi:hypothetical protein
MHACEQERRAVANGQEATLICDATLVESGFYPAEQSQGGTIFRWIGPQPLAAVFLPPIPAPVEVSLHIHSAFLPDVLDEVRMALDGGEWVPAILRQDAQGTRLCACLQPGPMAHLGALRLDIDSVRTETPRQRGETDGRHLSLALSAVTVRRIGPLP